MARYGLELTGGMVVYGISLVLAAFLQGYHGVAGIGLALIPMPATVLVAWVILRAMRRMDEMHLRQTLETLALAFAMTALLTFNYGFLEDAGFPRLSAFWVWPVMAVSWVLGGVLVRLRYR